MLKLLNDLNDKEISKTNKKNVDSTLTCGVFTREALILLVVLLPVSNIGTLLEISQHSLKNTKMKLRKLHYRQC